MSGHRIQNILPYWLALKSSIFQSFVTTEVAALYCQVYSIAIKIFVAMMNYPVLFQKANYQNSFS